MKMPVSAKNTQEVQEKQHELLEDVLVSLPCIILSFHLLLLLLPYGVRKALVYAGSSNFWP